MTKGILSNLICVSTACFFSTFLILFSKIKLKSTCVEFDRFNLRNLLIGDIDGLGKMVVLNLASDGLFWS